MDKYSLNISELTSRIASIQQEITREEEQYITAAAQDISAQELNEIKDRISFLKRKYALYKQAEQMRYNASK